jgi:hypothetical protein
MEMNRNGSTSRLRLLDFVVVMMTLPCCNVDVLDSFRDTQLVVFASILERNTSLDRFVF